ncbi:hypothetical protein BDV93DRAFT_596625 [Ceratobasidium sp. AG-I]|nr:hypothetical protein BDV93DRAFT_596625 [Ceratobasidium sp. AG-I]
MDHTRKGSLAAAASLDGTRLKVLVVGEGGMLRDANGLLGKSSVQDSRLPNYLGLADSRGTLGSKWIDGGVVDVVHLQSAVAVCTIEQLNLICVFYQLPDGSIAMRRCHMGAGWKWESGKCCTFNFPTTQLTSLAVDLKTVIAADHEAAPVAGTGLVAQPTILRVGDTSDLKLFYQTTEGTLAVQRVTESGELGGPAFVTQLAIPDCTPFTALTSGEDFTISYVTLRTKEVWECSGTLSPQEDDEEFYISVAQRFELRDAPDVIQLAAFQAEHPIVFLMTGSPISRVVWSSGQNRRKYLVEARGLPETGIALVGHMNARSSVTYFFVDTNGAVNVGRLASGSPDGKQLPDHYPIPLGSMRAAFGWTIPGWTGYSEVVGAVDLVVPETAYPRMISNSTQQSLSGRGSFLLNPTRTFSNSNASNWVSTNGTTIATTTVEEDDRPVTPPIPTVQHVSFEEAEVQPESVETEECEQPEDREGIIGHPNESIPEEVEEPTQVSEYLPELIEAPTPELQPEVTEEDSAQLPTTPPSSAYTVPESIDRQPFAEMLYDRLELVFKPAGSQYLSLQLPARDLEQQGLTRKSSGAYGGMQEPAALKEAHFRLADDLFDVAKFVSQPNGKSLSAVYEQILDNVAPKFEEDAERAKREQMRQWLLTGVEECSAAVNDQALLGISMTTQHFDLPRSAEMHLNPPSHDQPQAVANKGQAHPSASNGGFEIKSHSPQTTLAASSPTVHSKTRMQHAQLLFDAYMQARFAWETERDCMIIEASHTTDIKRRDMITRRLADITRERETKLAALYSDAVVRGNLRDVREYLGHLDFKSTSELLLSARESLRESARSPLESSNVTYPIKMLPADWLESSTTSYNAEELFYDVSALQTELIQKSITLDSLCDQLFALRMPNQEHIKTLETQIDDLTKAQNELKGHLVSGYSMTTLTSAKLGLNLAVPFDGRSFGVSEPTHSHFPENSHPGMGSLQEIQQKLTNAGRAYTRETARIEMAKKGDAGAIQSQMQQQVAELYSDIGRIEARMMAAQMATTHREQDAAKSISEIHLPPTDDSRWTTISLSTWVPNETWKQIYGNSADIALWLGNGGIGSTLSGGVNSSAKVEQGVTVEVNLRVSRVKIDRSSWFQPQFMNKPSELVRKPDHRPWSQWPASVNNTQEAITSIKEGRFDAGESLLPAYADAYIIAKDILVKVPTPLQVDTTHTLAQDSATADGILCFGFSHTFQSTSNLSQLHMQQMSDGTVYRIPGPQILGYIMQLTPVDTSSTYDLNKGTGVDTV